MKHKVVIEIRGGTLAAVYASSSQVEAHVVDWDDIEEQTDTGGSRIQPDSMDAMPEETKQRIDRESRAAALRSGSHRFP
jgi:hypothetical protein